MEKTGQKNGFLCLTAGLVILIIADILIIHTYIYNYNEKITILCVMLEEQENGTDSLMTAADLLKEVEDSRGTEGRKILESYGYLKGQSNGYSLELKHDTEKVLLLSLLLYGVYLLALWSLHRLEKRQYEQKIRQIGMVLEQFRKYIYHIEPFSGQGGDAVMEQMYQQLETFSEQLRLNEARMELEKEETKSLVTDISHQLKTPVAAVKTCFEILRQDDLEPQERAEFSRQCSHQLSSLELLVSSLVNISRMK